MTVKELIEVLSKMPQDVEVLYRACSDWNVLEPEEVKLVMAEQKEIIFRTANGYSDYNRRWAPPTEGDEYSDFRTVVTLPGN